MQNSAGEPILALRSPSLELGSELTGSNLRAVGATLQRAGIPAVRLYAPPSWEPGSSYSHLDDDAYPQGKANSLMTPKLADGEAIREPGPIAVAVLADMGWKVDLDAYGISERV